MSGEVYTFRVGLSEGPEELSGQGWYIGAHAIELSKSTGLLIL